MENRNQILPQVEKNEGKEYDEVLDIIPDVVFDIDEIMEDILRDPVSNDPAVLHNQINILIMVNKALIGAMGYKLNK